MVMRITGLASGLDTDKIINDLMRAQRMRVLDPLVKKKQLLQWKQEGYRDVNTKMSALKNSVFDLKLQASFNSRKAAVANESIANASANSNTLTGSYSLNVKSLATAAKSASTAAIGSGSGINVNLKQQLGLATGEKIEFTLKGKDGEKAFTFDGTETIHDMMSEINKSGLGIQATYDSTSDRVFFSSTTTGKDALIEMTDTSGHLANTFNLDTTTVIGTNAVVDFNGANDLEYSSNSFSIAGVNINLKSVGSTEIAVTQNTDAIFDKITSFVESYNTLLSHLSSITTTGRDRDYQPLTDDERAELSEEEITKWEAKAKEGIFGGDNFLTSMISGLRMTAMGGINGLHPEFSSLSAFGINTSAYVSGSSGNAVLTIDEDELRAAIAENPDKVMEFFTGNADKGIEGWASKVSRQVEKNIESLSSRAGSGAYTSDGSSMSEQLRALDTRIDIVKERNEKLEERYWAQYTALETAMSKLQAQSDWLANQLASFGNAK